MLLIQRPPSLWLIAPIKSNVVAGCSRPPSLKVEIDVELKDVIIEKLSRLTIRDEKSISKLAAEYGFKDYETFLRAINIRCKNYRLNCGA